MIPLAQMESILKQLVEPTIKRELEWLSNPKTILRPGSRPRSIVMNTPFSFEMSCGCWWGKHEDGKHHSQAQPFYHRQELLEITKDIGDIGRQVQRLRDENNQLKRRNAELLVENTNLKSQIKGMIDAAITETSFPPVPPELLSDVSK